MTQTLKSKKGVTLVELLAVIVILGIIAAIAVPAIGGLIERQRENAAGESYNMVVQSAKSYALSEQDNVFTLDDLTPTYLESNPFDLVYGAVTITEAEIQITVSGSSVTFAYTGSETFDAADLTINGFVVIP